MRRILIYNENNSTEKIWHCTPWWVWLGTGTVFVLAIKPLSHPRSLSISKIFGQMHALNFVIAVMLHPDYNL